MENCQIIKFKRITDSRGNLVPIQFPNDIPFEIKRIYYLYEVTDERGFHSHKDLEQILIALNGEIKIKTKTPFDEEIFKLNNAAEGLYIGPMVWREMFDFTQGSVLLVLASRVYDESDYLRDYKEYEQIYIKEYKKR